MALYTEVNSFINSSSTINSSNTVLDICKTLKAGGNVLSCRPDVVPHDWYVESWVENTG